MRKAKKDAKKEKSSDGQYPNQIDFIFVAKDGEVLYNQQKQDQELTVDQIMNSYCQIQT